jgi:dTMP kinase
LSEYYQSQNIPYKALRFPERSTKIGRVIADYLLGDDPIDPKTLHCLFAANRYEFRMEILEALSLGLIVIIDRYVYSGAVFGSMNGCDYAWCKHVDAFLPEPDVKLFINISTFTMMERQALRLEMGKQEEVFETRSFQKGVADLFLKIINEDEGWSIINGEQHVDKVHADIISKCRLK